MNIRQLRNFVVLAETLNYRKAAEILHITQPPLSISIRNLEERLGLVLFERTRRGTALTAAGRATLDSARHALLHTERFLQTAAALVQGETGELRMGFIGSANYALLPRLLPRFTQRHPGVTLQLHDSTTARIVAMLRRDELDLGFVRVPLADAHQDLELLPVENDHFVVALPAGHALAEQPTLSLADLADEPFVFYAREDVPGLHAIAMQLCRQAGFTPRIHQQAVQVQTLVSLVESRLGIALVPSVAARHANPAVVFRTLQATAQAPAIGIAIASLRSRRTPAATRFMELARQCRAES